MRKKLNYILISLIIGLSVAILFIAFTGPGNKTPGEGSPDFWKVSDSGVYFNVSGKNVGIGTNNPQYLLDVNGGIRIGNTFNIKEGVIRYRSDQKQFEGYDGSNWIPFAGNWTDQGNYIFARNTTSPNIVVVDDNGNVGIGTAEPTAPLHVYSTVSNGVVQKIDSTNTQGRIIFYESGTNRGQIGFGDGGNIFSGASTDSFSIRAEGDLHLGGTGDNLTMTIKNGNVGIGTTDPGAKLDINQTTASDSLRIQDDGTTVVRIYDGGIIDFPKQSVCRVHLSANLSVAGGFTEVLIPFDVVDIDTQGEWDTTNHRWTASKSGTYLITLTGEYSDLPDGAIVGLRLHKNGAFIGLDFKDRQAGAGVDNMKSYSDVFNLSAGDYIEAYTLHNDASSRTFRGGNYSALSIIKLN